MRFTLFISLLATFLFATACGDDDSGDASPLADARVDAGRDDASESDAEVLPDADGEDADIDQPDAMPDALIDATPDATVVDPCEGAILCENFDTYDFSNISNNMEFGPWRATAENSDTFEIDDSFAFAGGKSLHTRMNRTDQRRRGGRLFANPSSLGSDTTKLHGRMMMYVGENGVTNHWTWGGVSGPALAPQQGRNATYLFSSLRSMDRNQFSAVNYINTSPAQDCWNRSGEFIEADKWMCMQWSVDSEAQSIKMTLDGTEILSVSGSGQGCVGGVANDSPWVGPNISQLYVGTWSFHPVDAPLEMWIDEVVVDDAPVPCP